MPSECAHALQGQKRVNGASLNAEEKMFVPSEYAHVLQRPKRVHGTSMKADEKRFVLENHKGKMIFLYLIITCDVLDFLLSFISSLF